MDQKEHHRQVHPGNSGMVCWVTQSTHTQKEKNKLSCCLFLGVRASVPGDAVGRFIPRTPCLGLAAGRFLGPSPPTRGSSSPWLSSSDPPLMGSWSSSDFFRFWVRFFGAGFASSPEDSVGTRGGKASAEPEAPQTIQRSFGLERLEM